MRKSLKVLVSIVCVFAIFIVSYTPALAAAAYSNTGISTNVSDSQFIKMMEDMGYTDEEVSYILELEQERRENSTTKAISLSAFPTNPYVGQKYTQEYSTIYWSTLGTVSAASIAAALVKAGVVGVIATIIAAGLINQWVENKTSRGFIMSIQYVYGETNDGVPGWNMGMWSSKLVY